MTEFRRLKMKIGEAEFEADVPENKVQPMYAQFLFMLERQSRASVRLFGTNVKVHKQKPELQKHDIEVAVQTESSAESHGEPHGEPFDQTLLMRIFEMRDDGAVTLKVLPKGPDTNADAMLLLLYGYYRLKNEEYVLATQLFRAADQSGISLRRPANEQVRNGRFVIRGGQRKGSHYALNTEGLAMAKEIMAKIFE